MVVLPDFVWGEDFPLKVNIVLLLNAFLSVTVMLKLFFSKGLKGEIAKSWPPSDTSLESTTLIFLIYQNKGDFLFVLILSNLFFPYVCYALAKLSFMTSVMLLTPLP